MFAGTRRLGRYLRRDQAGRSELRCSSGVAVPHRFLMTVLVTRGVHVGIQLKLSCDSYDGNQGTTAL